jgi:hypothetical protein
MTAANDLRDIRDELDGVLHGALWPASLKCSTVVGQEAQALAEQLRKRLYHSWSENCALRARLARALVEEDAQRAINERLTAELEASDQALRERCRERLAQERGRGVDALFPTITVPWGRTVTGAEVHKLAPPVVRTVGRYEPTEEVDEL